MQNPAAEPPPPAAQGTKPRGALQRLWPRRIAWRLTLGFGSLVLLILVVLGQTGYQMRVVSEITRNFATGDMQRLLRVQNLSIQTEGAGSALVRLVHAPRNDRVKEYANVDARNRAIDGVIESLRTELQDPVQQATLQRLMECRSVYRNAFIDTVDQIEAEDLAAAARLLNDKVNPALNDMLRESNELLQRERLHVETQLNDAQALFEQAAWWLGGLSVLITALAGALAWQTTRSVVRPLGVLENGARTLAQGQYSKHLEPTGTREVDRVGRALNAMADAVAQREQEIVRVAFEDGLTGLPNRTALLHPPKPPELPFNTLLLLDLSRLKVVNETLGYTTGDTLIKELALRCKTVLAQAGQAGGIHAHYALARLSGGTFAAAFHASSRVAADQIYQQLQEANEVPVVCSGHSVDMSVRCGCADAAGGAQGVEVLLRNAEVALHAAKRDAHPVAWYNEAQEAARLDHLGLLSDLRTAVATDQLQMWLQPKLALSTGKPVGAEALVRWVHPQRGFVSPAAFIPFAEQTGYITMLTDWMLDQALTTLQRWASTYPDLSIAVNLSTRDLQDPAFVARVAAKVTARGVNPQRLRLEVTESGVMQDAAQSLALLHALRAVGMPLSIDDFGTGYSSLAYLQKMPVSELKIDRSFVDGINAAPASQRLVKAMIEMGHGLDLIVTAEGVETAEERDMLISLGCDVMQGYFGSKPLHGEAMEAWLLSNA